MPEWIYFSPPARPPTVFVMGTIAFCSRGRYSSLYKEKKKSLIRE
jgi:hypothetical protein